AAVPAVDEVYEVKLAAGHFGLVVGTTALTVTWPTAAAWLRHVSEGAPAPANAKRIAGDDHAHGHGQPVDVDEDIDELDDGDFDAGPGETQYHIGPAQDVVSKTARAIWDRPGDVGQDPSDSPDTLRWQVPPLPRLRRLGDDTAISLGRTLTEQAAEIPDRTF